VTRTTRCSALVLLAGTLVAFAACSGSPNTPNGPVVNDPGSGAPPGTSLIGAQVSIAVPIKKKPSHAPDYLSSATQSVSISLASVGGEAVTGVNATTINTNRGAKNCTAGPTSVVCLGTVQAAAGQDIFNVTTYQWPNATGAILSSGTVRANIGPSGGGVNITNTLSLSLEGIIAKLSLVLGSTFVDRGKKQTIPVTLESFDAGGAQIIGPSDFQSPVALTIQGDSANAFVLRSGTGQGTALSILKPPGPIQLTYDGNIQANPIAVQATVAGPSSPSAQVPLDIHGATPPPSGGDIYVLNGGPNIGEGATVTVYSNNATGNVAPTRTLQLSKSLSAASIAVDSKGDLYVGYLNGTGYDEQTGIPDTKNEIAVYSPTASGSAQPTSVLQSNAASQSALFPIAMAFDATGDLVTYGSTGVESSTDQDGVLIYPPDASGSVAPLRAWNFASPAAINFTATIVGLALDSAGNFYINGSLKTTLSPVPGVFVQSAQQASNPFGTPARTIPYDSTTGLNALEASNLALDASGEIYVANFSATGSNPTTCQAKVSVFSAGATGGSTDIAPLRVLTLDGVSTTTSDCYVASQSPLTPFFPRIAVSGSSIYAANPFGNSISIFASSGSGTVSPTQTISGSSTELNAPIGVTVAPASTKNQISGRTRVRPDLGSARSPSTFPFRPLVH
jgi:hypothetical protein